MSSPKLIFISFFVSILFLSCSREEIITIEENAIDSIISKSLKTTNTKVFHFITFDPKNPKKFRKFISKITKLAKQKNRKILTKGISGNGTLRSLPKYYLYYTISIAGGGVLLTDQLPD